MCFWVVGKRRGDAVAKVDFMNAALAAQTDACILWPFKIGTHGYGNFKEGHAHAAICAAAHGPRPTPAHEAAHSCGKRLCCNERHLRWATGLENTADKYRHGTVLYGEKHQNHKFTNEQIAAIRNDPRSSYTLEGAGVASARYVRRVRQGVRRALG